MSVLTYAAKIGLLLAVLGGLYFLLPDAIPEVCLGAPEAVDCSTALVVPDPIWDGLVAVIGLDDYMPISELIGVASLSVGIRGGMAALWVFGWIFNKVKPA